MITAHLSEIKNLKKKEEIATDFLSELTINGEVRQKVTDKRLLTLTIRGYPYIDIISILDKGKNMKEKNIQEIHNYSDDGLVETFIINENIHKNTNEGRYIISRKIDLQAGKSIKQLNSQDISIRHSWDETKEKGETIIGINYSDSTDRIIGDEEIQISNKRVEYPIQETEIEELSNFMDQENEEFKTFFSNFIESINYYQNKTPEDIYIKQVKKHRDSKDPSLKELLKNLDSAPIYPFENTCNIERKYGVIEIGYKEGNTERYIKAIAFSPSEETGNRPVYMIIKEKINVEEGIEYVEKDFFIDDDKTAVLRHLINNPISYLDSI